METPANHGDGTEAKQLTDEEIRIQARTNTTRFFRLRVNATDVEISAAIRKYSIRSRRKNPTPYHDVPTVESWIRAEVGKIRTALYYGLHPTASWRRIHEASQEASRIKTAECYDLPPDTTWGQIHAVSFEINLRSLEELKKELEEKNPVPFSSPQKTGMSGDEKTP